MEKNMVKNKKKRTLIGVLTVLVLIAAFVGGHAHRAKTCRKRIA